MIKLTDFDFLDLKRELLTPLFGIYNDFTYFWPVSQFRPRSPSSCCETYVLWLLSFLAGTGALGSRLTGVLVRQLLGILYVTCLSFLICVQFRQYHHSSPECVHFLYSAQSCSISVHYVDTSTHHPNNAIRFHVSTQIPNVRPLLETSNRIV